MIGKSHNIDSDEGEDKDEDENETDDDENLDDDNEPPDEDNPSSPITYYISDYSDTFDESN